jgi:hypothetical protein
MQSALAPHGTSPAERGRIAVGYGEREAVTAITAVPLRQFIVSAPR